MPRSWPALASAPASRSPSRGLVPTHPDLRAALTHLHTAARIPDSASDRRTQTRARVAAWLDTHGPTAWLRIPASDLAVLGWTRENLLVQKLTVGLLELALPVVTFGMIRAAGFGLGYGVPVVVTLAVGLAMSLLPDLAARSQAAEARMEFRRAVGAYFDLFALERTVERPSSGGLRRREPGWSREP